MAASGVEGGSQRIFFILQTSQALHTQVNTIPEMRLSILSPYFVNKSFLLFVLSPATSLGSAIPPRSEGCPSDSSSYMEHGCHWLLTADVCSVRRCNELIRKRRTSVSSTTCAAGRKIGRPSGPDTSADALSHQIPSFHSRVTFYLSLESLILDSARLGA